MDSTLGAGTSLGVSVMARYVDLLRCWRLCHAHNLADCSKHCVQLHTLLPLQHSYHPPVCLFDICPGRETRLQQDHTHVVHH